MVTCEEPVLMSTIISQSQVSTHGDRIVISPHSGRVPHLWCPRSAHSGSERDWLMERKITREKLDVNRISSVFHKFCHNGDTQIRPVCAGDGNDENDENDECEVGFGLISAHEKGQTTVQLCWRWWKRRSTIWFLHFSYARTVEWLDGIANSDGWKHSEVFTISM